MEPSLNTWTIFFLVAAVQGLFLALMIFLRKSKANNLLGFLILSFSVCMIYYVLFWTGYNQKISPLFGMAQGLTYALGPLLYFYILSNKKEAVFNKWHFIPLALFIPYYISNTLVSPEIRTISVSIQTVLQNLHLVIYSALIFRFTYKNKGFSNGALKLYNWRKKLTWAFAGYTISFLSYYMLVWSNKLLIEHDYAISVASTFFIYFIGYHGFQHQELFKIYENGRYEKSGLNSSASTAILSELRRHMEIEKTYLDSSLRLQDLANKLNLSQHYVSQVINDLDGKNFADFINEYRVEEAKKLLLESDNKKIIHIAYDSGFNNKVSFNSTFKKFTGMSPSEFRVNQAQLV